MKLGEFIEKFSHNNLIRLVYKHKGGHKLIEYVEGWNTVGMDWAVNKAQGKYRHYINNEVLGVVSIATGGQYPEAITICIEKLEDQPLVEEIIKERGNQESVSV